MEVFDLSDFNQLENSLTKYGMQYGWGAKYYFPLCPNEIRATSIDDYLQNFKVGSIFAYHDDAPKLIIVKFLKIKNNSSILVMCESEGDWCEINHFFPWLICEIIFENGFFIHSNLGSYFEKEEADQEFNIKQGRNMMTEI